MTVRANALGSRYELEQQIGSGAMGTVWRARDLSTQEAVAAKVLHDHFSSDVGIVTRFLQERTFLLQLQHPGIVRVRDLVVEGDQLGIVMDLVDGSDVRRLLATSPTLAPSRAAAIAADVLDALAHAHALSVLHRDVKPDNVLLDGETPRLSDFSIARLAQETTVRMTGVLGTADYMAPEVFAEQVSAASDVYGAGVMLYEMLAGRTPFGGPGANAWSIAKRHESVAPPPLPGLAPELAALLQAMLDKVPAARPTAAAASAGLRRLLPELAGLAALPVQPAPAAWEQVAPAHDGVTVRSAAPFGGDVAQTYLGGATSVGQAPMPVAGPAPAAAAGPADAGLTQLGQEVRSRPALDVPEVVPAAPARTRSRAAKAGAVAALLALAGAVVALVVVLGGGRHGSSAATGPAGGGSAAIEADGPAEQSLSGLDVQRHATYDPRARTVAVTVTYSSALPLAGPFLEAVPQQTDAVPGCPDVEWSGAVTGRPATTTGLVGKACAQSVDAGSVRGDTTAGYTVQLELKGKDKRAALVQWLQRAHTLQEAALRSVGFRPDYAAQRLAGISVAINATPALGRQVDLKVLPVWETAGGTAADTTEPLLSTAGGYDQELVQQLGGARRLVLSSTTCSDVLSFGRDGIPYATGKADACTVQAALGSLVDESPAFSILVGSS